jgi:hypothetical protein
MMSQDKINQLEDEIQQAEVDYQTFLRKQEAERDEAETVRTETIARLQAERDALALEMKLAEFPRKLVEEHKTCSICGAVMRPFKIAEGEKVVKIWACSAASLSPAHDLLRVAG